MTYIYDTDFHQVSPQYPTKCAPISIGSNVWIGANSMILAGSKIGDHSVIAAGLILSGEISTEKIGGGAPPTRIKKQGTDGRLGRGLGVAFSPLPVPCDI